MPTTLERLQYGFDRDSRRTWRRRTLTTGEDNAYGYDGLSQVVQDARGNLNLNQSAVAGIPVRQENWDYDPTGNWKGYRVEANGAVSLEQERVHDKGNRLTRIVEEAEPYLLDRVGRMTQMSPDASGDWEDGLQLKWDAWGRLTQIKRVSNEAVLGSYAYDGLTRRITREVASVVQHFYYSKAWRPLEERLNAATSASVQYLWGARHRDDLVRRDRDVDGDGDLDEKRYVLMDYFSPASIVDEEGEVTERYAFSAFGIRRIMAPDFSSRSTSECAWEFGFQGQFLDAESSLLNYGYRYYSPYLGRWTCKDPIGIDGGFNIYAYPKNDSLNRNDLFGLESCSEEGAQRNCDIADVRLSRLDPWINPDENDVPEPDIAAVREALEELDHTMHFLHAAETFAETAAQYIEGGPMGAMAKTMAVGGAVVGASMGISAAVKPSEPHTPEEPKPKPTIPQGDFRIWVRVKWQTCKCASGVLATIFRTKEWQDDAGVTYCERGQWRGRTTPDGEMFSGETPPNPQELDHCISEAKAKFCKPS